MCSGIYLRCWKNGETRRKNIKLGKKHSLGIVLGIFINTEHIFDYLCTFQKKSVIICA